MRKDLFKRTVASVATVTVIATGMPQMGLVYASPAIDASGLNMAVQQDAQKVWMHSILNPSKLNVKSIAANTVFDGYTINATSSKKVDIAAMEKEGQTNWDFVNAIKLNGTGSETERSIHFKTEGAATVTLYALSGGGERNFALYKAGGEVVTTFPVAINTTTVITPITFQITEAGDYYFASPSGGVNVFYLDVAEEKEGIAEPERPEWSSVTAPQLLSAKVNPVSTSQILVNWKMDISNSGADRVVAQLIDADGKVDTKATYRTEGNEGSIALKPTKSGNFKVVVNAYRAGEEEVKSSSELAVNDYVRPLDSFEITKALTGKNSSLQLAWEKVSEADTYNISYKEVGTDNVVDVVKGLKDTEYVITTDLTALKEYEITVTAVRGADTKTATINKTIQKQAERWLSGLVGSGSKGSEIKVNADGTITMNNTSGKIAESEDQFSYYYTEIDPKEENFTLTATFRVDNSASKDNQSGFGIMAVDTLDTVNDARYMNSVASMVTRFTVDPVNKEYLYGIPGLRTITGYTEAPTDSQAGKRVMDATKNFDPNFNLDKANAAGTPNAPRFFDGEEYTFTLQRCNGGYLAQFEDQNGEKYDNLISYDETLLTQDADKLYVGFVVGRKITATVTDYTFTTVKPEEDPYVLPEREITKIEPTIKSDTTKTTSSTDYKPVFVSNVAGNIQIADQAGKILVKDVPVLAKQRKEIPVTLTQGTNKLKVTFTPAVKEAQDLPAYTDLSSYDPITSTLEVTVKAYGTEENAIYVSPQGTANGKGTKASPLDISTAVAFVQPGQEIILLGGEYKLSSAIEIPRGLNGTAEKRITLMSDPSEKAVLNFADSTTGGIILKADYWHIYNLEIKNTKQGKPMHIQGNNNIAEKLLIHDNADTGLQINGSSEESYAMWPSNNLVQSVEVYNSCDPLANDADGFAAKITVGDNNVFRYCISHHNIDDGWDLYAKSTSGSIGAVTIDSCVAYSNGKLTEDSGNTQIGEGNGFKLGGESMPGAHILKNSVSFNNLAKGVTSNSGPDPKVYNVTSFANQAENLALYTNAAKTEYEVTGFLSYKPAKTDYIEVKEQDAIVDATNYLNGVNAADVSVNDSWFASTETVTPTFNQDGTINLGDFLKLTDKAAADTGARFTANANPTVIVIGTEIGSKPVVTPTETPATQAPTAKPTTKPTQKPATPNPTVKPTMKPVTKVAITKVKVSSISNKTYTGKAIKPAVTLKYNKKALKKGTDYTVSYKNNVKTGKATITIKGKGKYTGTKKVYFNIVPKKVGSIKVSSKKSRTATVSYKKVTGASGYQISYKTSKKGKYKVAGYTTKTSKTITKLSKKKTIYVRVRAYKTINGKKVYGSYSTVKSVKVK
ncbi:MAG: fibronectin type III domain-containing protein [bacterium]|nr:fibronectin type III domain-containing protein [bacterium]